jgi:hypothetical protein
LSLRVGDQRVQQRGLPVSVLKPGRIPRMRAEPQLGLGMGGRDRASGEFSDSGP